MMVMVVVIGVVVVMVVVVVVEVVRAMVVVVGHMHRLCLSYAAAFRFNLKVAETTCTLVAAWPQLGPA